MIEPIVFLNGKFIEQSRAMISPLDRGFLFGDGIYEVIPSEKFQLVGFPHHIKRLQNGLSEVGIELQWHEKQWREMVMTLLERNGGGCLNVYLHVSRGTESSRRHQFSKNTKPTIFAMCQPFTPVAPQESILHVVTQEDMRWRRCHVKSTSLLGNVMHYNYACTRAADETILYNTHKFVTEASTSNVFIVKKGQIKTPALDTQLLPGVTRALLLYILGQYSDLRVLQSTISIDELYQADEVWLTSSSKNVSPVLSVDGRTVGKGEIGKITELAQSLFASHKFDNIPLLDPQSINR